METLLSLDIDRTLVDRSASSHSLPGPLRDEVVRLANSNSSGVVLNTGRDPVSVTFFEEALGEQFDTLFLSGRGIRRRGGSAVAFSSALLPKAVVDVAKALVLNGVSPFIDLKFPNSIAVVRHRGMFTVDVPFGFQKPKTWYPRECCEELELEVLDSLSPLRVEVPVVVESWQRVYTTDLTIAAVVQAFPDLQNFQVEIRDAHDDYPGLKGLVKIVQVLSPRELHNKGTGLLEFLRLLPSRPQRIVHVGDSLSEQNSDALVTQVVPGAEFYLAGSGTELGRAESLVDFLRSFP